MSIYAAERTLGTDRVTNFGKVLSGGTPARCAKREEIEWTKPMISGNIQTGEVIDYREQEEVSDMNEVGVAKGIDRDVVLSLVVDQGLSGRAAARQLDVYPGTVRHHVQTALAEGVIVKTLNGYEWAKNVEKPLSKDDIEQMIEEAVEQRLEDLDEKINAIALEKVRTTLRAFLDALETM